MEAQWFGMMVHNLGTTNQLTIGMSAENQWVYLFCCQSWEDEFYLIPIKSLSGLILAMYVLTDSLRFGSCLNGIGLELSKCSTI